MNGHTRGGNCFHSDVTYECAECGKGNFCDVCHEHCEPRGECSECRICVACENEEILETKERT